MEDNKNNNTPSIFRKSALNQVTSPEELDKYLVVTGPGIWLVLLTVIVLLAGIFAWMIFGQLDTVKDVAVAAQDGQVLCYVPTDSVQPYLQSGEIEIAGKKYKLSDAGLAPCPVTEETDISLRIAGQLPVGIFVTPLRVDASLADGIYTGAVVVESVKPISFIIN